MFVEYDLYACMHAIGTEVIELELIPKKNIHFYFGKKVKSLSFIICHL